MIPDIEQAQVIFLNRQGHSVSYCGHRVSLGEPAFDYLTAQLAMVISGLEEGEEDVDG